MDVVRICKKKIHTLRAIFFSHFMHASQPPPPPSPTGLPLIVLVSVESSIENRTGVKTLQTLSGWRPAWVRGYGGEGDWCPPEALHMHSKIRDQVINQKEELKNHTPRSEIKSSIRKKSPRTSLQDRGWRPGYEVIPPHLGLQQVAGDTPPLEGS